MMSNICYRVIWNVYIFHIWQTDKSGCFEMEVETEPYHLNSYNYRMTFDAEATLTENGTGNVSLQ